MDWELTDEEIIALMHLDVPGSVDSFRRIIAAAVQKYRDYLAKQVGGGPCEWCSVFNECGRRVNDKTVWVKCEEKAKYEGQLAGLAKGMQMAESKMKCYEDALIHIEEYWNRGENNMAMNDALYHMIETAQQALSSCIPLVLGAEMTEGYLFQVEHKPSHCWHIGGRKWVCCWCGATMGGDGEHGDAAGEDGILARDIFGPYVEYGADPCPKRPKEA